MSHLIRRVGGGEFFSRLTAFPHVAEGPFKAKPDCPPRSAGPERDRLFVAWSQGRPAIIDRRRRDAPVEQDRMDGIIACAHDRGVVSGGGSSSDWRSGERYFMEQLVDGDLAANNGNWQWCASTGTDAMQGYRILTLPFKAVFSIQTGHVRQYVLN